MQLIQKFQSRKGQNIIEYSLLLVLVIIAIMVMGPYVIKSWNAHIKGWEDSALDSMYDPFEK
jgi:uncharacterized protein (UPF0333 family)